MSSAHSSSTQGLLSGWFLKAFVSLLIAVAATVITWNWHTGRVDARVNPARANGAAIARHLTQSLTDRWSEFSSLRLPFLQYTNGQLVSGVAPLGEINVPRDVNIAFIDYQCAFCRGDHERFMNLVRAHPQRRYYIVQTPVLGVRSTALAQLALRSAAIGDFGTAHEFLTNSIAPTTTIDAAERALERRIISIPHGALTDSASEEEQLAAHARFRDALGVVATPAYVLNGTVVLGTIRQLPAET